MTARLCSLVTGLTLALSSFGGVAGAQSPSDEAGTDAPEARRAPRVADNRKKLEASTDGEATNDERRRAAPPSTFERGLGDYYTDDFVDAAAAMYDYIATNESTVENYEWAEYFLGRALIALNFDHAGAEYLFNVAKNRSRPEILPDALTTIEALLERPHDEQLLEGRLLTDSDFGYLPGSIDDFVAYHQGLADLRAGRVPWSERLFDRIDTEGPYRPKALYALGVQRLKGNRMTDAVKLFRQALNHPQADRDIRNQCRLALARVLYEKERYRAALRIYGQVEVPELTLAEASLFLEKAWTHYWMRDYRKTMGILYALEAPSYRDYHAPEKFLLRALVYK
ncbi:MAG: hypothetical protein AAF449_14130, partial [Myxococcota bacterium]